VDPNVGETGARKQKNHKKGKMEEIPNFEAVDVPFGLFGLW
jgi:hypothetical protein